MLSRNTGLALLVSLSALKAQPAPDLGEFLTGGLFTNRDKEEMQFLADGRFLYSIGKLTDEYRVYASGDDDYFEVTPPNVLKIGFREPDFKPEICIHYYTCSITSNRYLEIRNYLILVGTGGRMAGEYKNVIPLKHRFYQMDMYFGDVRFDSATQKAFFSVMGVVAEGDFEFRGDGLIAFSHEGNVSHIFRHEFRGDTLFLEDRTNSYHLTKQATNPILFTRSDPAAVEPGRNGTKSAFNVLGRRIRSGSILPKGVDAKGFLLEN